jgi:hypothetical protein
MTLLLILAGSIVCGIVVAGIVLLLAVNPSVELSFRSILYPRSAWCLYTYGCRV